MNEKQVKLNEFMIAFEKKSPLILISATAVNVTFMNKHPEASSLLLLLSLLLWLSSSSLLCDINCAGHFTLDALASRPVACLISWWLTLYLYWVIRYLPIELATAASTWFYNSLNFGANPLIKGIVLELWQWTYQRPLIACHMDS